MSTPANHRYGELDSLRGLAAVTVAVGHLSMVVFNAPQGALHPYWTHWRHVIMEINRTPLTVMMSGGAAVRFFFILSGFVLMLPYLRQPRQPYLPYLVKRVCRIYLPYLAAVGLAVVADALWGQRTLPGFTGAVADTWSKPISAHLILQHVLMLGSFDVGQFNTVLWSLVQEMRISIVYPILALAVYYCRPAQIAAILVSIEACVAFIAFCFPQADMGLQSFPSTLHFISIFILGALLAKHREDAAAWLRSHGQGAKALLAAAAFLAYSLGIKALWGAQLPRHVAAVLSRAHLASNVHVLSLASYLIEITGDWTAAICACVAICFALVDRRTKAVLNHRLVLVTGRASYTLYLVHATVLFSFLFILQGTPYFWMFVPAYLLGTLILTALFYNGIEVPTMMLGRNLSRRLRSEQAKLVAATE